MFIFTEWTLVLSAIQAAALACKQVPDSNASWHGDFVRHYDTVNVNLAVGLGDGLVTPVIRGVEGKGIKVGWKAVAGGW